MQQFSLVVKIALALLGLALLGYVWASGFLGTWISHVNAAQISTWVVKAGYWGPIVIIALMMAAVVASPIPSAPIAIAAGAAYGHVFGTVSIIVGAFLGAMIAFYISRKLGRKSIERWFGKSISTGFLGSQNALTATVLFSRLIPFISFDMISYAAGLSLITPLRFAAATLLGVVPMAFLMAHLGEMAIEGDNSFAQWFSVILGGFVALPVLALLYRKFRPVSR